MPNQPNQPQNRGNFAGEATQQQRPQQHNQQQRQQTHQPQHSQEQESTSAEVASETTQTAPLSVVDQFIILAALELKAIVDKTSNARTAKEAIANWWISLTDEERSTYRQEIIEKGRYIVAQIEEVMQEIPTLTMV